MEIKKVIEVLRTEQECVKRQGTPKCPGRECGRCDLCLSSEQVDEAYEQAIGLLELMSVTR